MRAWEATGTTQQQSLQHQHPHPQQQQQQQRLPQQRLHTQNHSYQTDKNSVPMKSHGVTFSLISRYQNTRGEDRNGLEAQTSVMQPHMSQSCGSNRNRADSGTSTFSGSSCDGAETPLLGAQQQKKTRKRSHRPRGCRGGSSRRGANRKAANSQLQQAQQQDNNGPPAIDGSHTLSTSLSDDIPLENMQPYSAYQQPSSQQRMPKLLNREQQPTSLTQVHFEQPAIDSFTADRAPFGYTSASNGSYPDRKPPMEQKQPLSVQESSYGNFFNSVFHRNKPPQQTTKELFCDAASDLNPFASTFDFLPPPSQEISLTYPETISASLSSSSSSSSEFILPPLPADALREEGPATFNGPNPYALNSFNHLTATSTASSAATNGPSRLPLEHEKRCKNHLVGPAQQPQHVVVASFHSDKVYCADQVMQYETHPLSSDYQQQSKPSISPIVTYQSGTDFPVPSPNSEGDANVSPCGSLECDSSYRSARIERQRQMMAQGGSLFVTSPRSFLLGWRKPTTSAPVM